MLIKYHVSCYLSTFLIKILNYKVVIRICPMCHTDSIHNLPIVENLLNQKVKISEPRTVWVTDITQLNTLEGPLYLATVKDISLVGALFSTCVRSCVWMPWTMPLKAIVHLRDWSIIQIGAHNIAVTRIKMLVKISSGIMSASITAS